MFISERQRDEVASTGTPSRAPIEQLWTGQGDDEDRMAGRPLEEVVDEVEQSRIRPLQVLEDQDGRTLRGDTLEERPPGREQLVPVAGRGVAEPQQREKGGLDPCDLAVERAFQSHEREVEGAKRHFSLDIELDGARLIATYEYSGGKLAVFSLTGVPSSWALYQKAGSKTLTFQLGEGRCAFDLCTAGPTPDGPCNKADIVAP